jgi:hypothetical protein
MDELSHQKIEHAVLWSIVKQSYDGEFICPPAIAAKLLNVAPESQVRVVVDHLIATGFLVDKSASLQEHFEPTRKAYLKIEQLIPVKASFVGRLNIHGPKWLRSQSARDAKLESRIEGDASAQPSVAAVHAAPAVVVNNTFSPMSEQEVNVSGARPSGNDSTLTATWFGAWGTWIAAIIALAALAWTLHEAKVF